MMGEELYDLPEGWVWVKLEDVAEVIMGQSPPGDSYNQEGLGVPLINGPVEFSKSPFSKTKKSKFTTQPLRMCRKNDLVLCVRGSTTGRINIARRTAYLSDFLENGRGTNQTPRISRQTLIHS